MPRNHEFEPVSDKRYMLRAGAALTGAAVVGTGLVAASLVIGSGASAAELGRDVWRSTADKRTRAKGAIRGLGEIAMEFGNNRVDSLLDFAEKHVTLPPATVAHAHVDTTPEQLTLFWEQNGRFYKQHSAGVGVVTTDINNPTIGSVSPDFTTVPEQAHSAALGFELGVSADVMNNMRGES